VVRIQVRAMDHVVLVVADVERSVAWYRDALGLEALRLDEWRAGTVFFPSLRIDEGTIIDIVPGERDPSARGNVDHFCLVVDGVDLDAVRSSGTFDVVEGPVTRWGARGDATSLYVRDPDGNVVELRCY
jgi:catechol 2,3-dioxygenase-like lactoylglutathione lyase family enzyme